MMLCKYCGTEIKEGWKVCPSCGTEVLLETEDTQVECREYKMKGMRRTGRFSFQDVTTDVKIEGENVHVLTKGVKKSESRFHKQEVQSIDFPLLPIWKISDILRLVVFGMLAFVTYGLSIFAILFSIKIMVSRHVRIKLTSGQTVKIPICQKGDASEFLKEFQYPLSEIEKNNAGRIDDKKWAQREWLTSAALLIVAAGAITVGITLKSESMQNSGNGKADNEEEQEDYGIRQEDKYILEDTELDIPSKQKESSETEEMDTNDAGEINVDEMVMYLDNNSGAFPVRVENVSQKSEYIGFTTIAFDMVNEGGIDVKEATFGIAAWDSNMLPLKLVEMYGIDATYYYKCQASNIADGQTSNGSITFEERDFKYIQIFLLECSDFDGNKWTNPAAPYYEENFAGKKFDESIMPAVVFDQNSSDEMDSPVENQEDTASYTGDFYTDVENGILYGKDGVIVDINGNPLSEYADYYITEEGYISNGDWVEEGYGIDDIGKIIVFQW